MSQAISPPTPEYPEFWECERDGYVVSTDPARLDLEVIHGFIRASYWAAEARTRETQARANAGSLCFGLYGDGQQLGFARMITDYATFAYLCDVFIAPEARGKGLGVWMMRCVHDHPDLQGLRRMMLATRDAHTLYEKSGYTPLSNADRWMERFSG